MRTRRMSVRLRERSNSATICKYPKTDYTYSPLSKDRVELAPGQVAVPNMSRRSLSQFRVQGPNTSVDEVDLARAAWTSSAARKRYTSIDSSDDESYFRGNGGPAVVEQRWWLTRMLLTIVTTITSAVSSTYRRVVGPAHRYPYTERRPQRAGILSRSASAAAAPFYWIYTVIKTVVTTTVTTVTETFSDSEATVGKRSAHQVESKRRWWPWLLLLLLPALGYGSYYTYENLDTIAPNFTDFHLDLSDFTPSLPSLPSLPALTLPNITIPSISLPDINITLPDIRENLPEVSKTYIEYRDIVHNRMLDASDYMKVVAESCFEEMRRFWHGVLG